MKSEGLDKSSDEPSAIKLTETVSREITHNLGFLAHANKESLVGSMNSPRKYHGGVAYCPAEFGIFQPCRVAG